jgi:hypothetical protein
MELIYLSDIRASGPIADMKGQFVRGVIANGRPGGELTFLPNMSPECARILAGALLLAAKEAEL